MSPPRKLITAAELSRFEQWELPVVGVGENRRGESEDELARPLTAAQLEALHAQAYQAGFTEGRCAGEEAGYRQGRASGEAEAAVLVGRLQSILGLMAAPLDDLDRRYPGIRFRMVDEQQRLRPHVRLFFAGEPLRDLDRALRADGELIILQALSGG